MDLSLYWFVYIVKDPGTVRPTSIAAPHGAIAWFLPPATERLSYLCDGFSLLYEALAICHK